MSKNNKKTFSRPRNVSPVEVLNMDVISYMNDDDILRRLDFLFTEKEKVSHANVDPTPWEIEICYAQRELKIRSGRKSLHERYLRDNRIEDHQEEQSIVVN